MVSLERVVPHLNAQLLSGRARWDLPGSIGRRRSSRWGIVLLKQCTVVPSLLVNREAGMGNGVRHTLTNFLKYLRV